MKTISRTYTYAVEKGRLRCYLRWEGRRLHLNVGVSVDLVDGKGKPIWDGRRAKPGSVHGPRKAPAYVVNTAIENFEHQLEGVFTRFEIREQIPSAAMVKNELRAESRGTHNLWDCYDEFIREESAAKGWSYNTIKSVTNVGRILKAFDSNMQLEDLTADTMRRFIQWQRKTTLSGRQTGGSVKGYADSAIAKHCRVVKWFQSWCVAKGTVSNDVFAMPAPQIKTIRRPVIYLTREEVETLASAEMETGSLKDRVRDLIVFCCYTGLRFSDATSLRWSHVKQDVIEIVTEKTRDRLRIDLNKHSRAILEKYREAGTAGVVFPKLVLNEVNYWIKIIGRDLGFNEEIQMARMVGGQRIDETFEKWELLSSHVGRRTFVVTALSLGIPVQIVMKWTGHSNYDAMRPYVDIVDSMKSDMMKKFDL